MIFLFICKLFGCKTHSIYYTYSQDEYYRYRNVRTFTNCPRCGKDLE